MAVLSSSLFFVASAIVASASTNLLRRRQSQRGNLAGPVDCYTGNGADYAGLADTTLTGRKCKKWVEEGTYTSIVGNFCRNPDTANKDKPWCFTVDPTVDWQFCEVPVCANAGAPLEAWTAPPGAKTSEAESKDCTYKKPTGPTYKEHEAGRACMNNQGKTWWLITNQMVEATDVNDCDSQCKMVAGSEYFTFYNSKFEGEDPVTKGKNCGCYRECILVAKDLTINGPTSYRMMR